jgi:hypothetical protein
VDVSNLSVGQKARHRIASKCDDDFGIDCLDLALQVVATGCQFTWQGIAIAWWTALNNVRDKYFRSLHANICQQLFQVLSSCPDERPALLVFMKAWPFTDE